MFRVYHNTYLRVINSFNNIIENINFPRKIIEDTINIISDFYMIRSVNKDEIIAAALYTSFNDVDSSFALDFLLTFYLENNIPFSLANIHYAIIFISEFRD